MLVKYYGLDTNAMSPRLDFISNGMFRMTQPKYLNDKGSEARLWPYFNKFAPADYAWAKREEMISQSSPSYIPSNEELEDIYLKPMLDRMAERFPGLLDSRFESIEDYDRSQLEQVTEKLNAFLVEAISCHLGVLSLSMSDTNELMWTHYSSEGEGMAVTFIEDHEFFKQHPPKKVSYNPEERASLTYYKGALRINGAPLKKYHIEELNDPFVAMQSLEDNGVDVIELSERLLYSKAPKWSWENETRIVLPLAFCTEHKGPVISPELGVEEPCNGLSILNDYSEICLLRIPFDAWESIVFGYRMSLSECGSTY